MFSAEEKQTEWERIKQTKLFQLGKWLSYVSTTKMNEHVCIRDKTVNVYGNI